MPALKSYNNFYEDGNTAKKRNFPERQERNIYDENNRRYGKNKIKQNTQAKSKKNTLVVVLIFSAFIMAMIVTYRYNIISEKNLEAQRLKSELSAVEAKLLNKQIEIEQQTDLNKVEAYAKQQLGMQKPDQSQTIYIDTSKSIEMVETNNDTTSIENIIDTIKNFFTNIF